MVNKRCLLQMHAKRCFVCDQFKSQYTKTITIKAKSRSRVFCQQTHRINSIFNEFDFEVINRKIFPHCFVQANDDMDFVFISVIAFV